MLERSLPELGAAAEHRRDHADLDPLAALHWSTLATLRANNPVSTVDHWDRVLLAALVLDVTHPDQATSPIVVARKTCQRLDVGAATEQAVAGLVADAGLLLGASRRLDGLGEESVLQLAAHLGTSAQADALFLLTQAYFELEPQERARLRALHGLLLDVLGHPDVHAARVYRDGNAVVGTFQLTDSKGRKLESVVQEKISDLVRSGVDEPGPRWRRLCRRWAALPPTSSAPAAP